MVLFEVFNEEGECLSSSPHHTLRMKQARAGGTALLSLAVGIATAGIGVTLAGSVSGIMGEAIGSIAARKIAGTMAATTFQTLTAQASVTLVNNRGDIGKTLKDLGSSQQVRALLTSVRHPFLNPGMTLVSC